MKKWSPRYFVITAKSIRLYKKDPLQYGSAKPDELIALTLDLLIGTLYTFEDGAPTVPGPKFLYQFKIERNRKMVATKYSGVVGERKKLVMKIGHVKEEGCKVIRAELLHLLMNLKECSLNGSNGGKKKNSFLKFEENGDEEDESSGVERGIFSPRKKSSSKKLNGGRYSDGKTTERNV